MINNPQLGNIELDSLSTEALRKKCICSEHFEKNQYNNPNDPKSRFNVNAVPNQNFAGTF